MKRLGVVEKAVRASGLIVLLSLQPCLASQSVAMSVDKVNATQQNILIKGKIIDKSGESLPGATVRITGKNQGAITDFDGSFTIEATKGDKREISFIGYISKIIVVDSQNNLVITLDEDSKTLDEVVVVGYGTQKNRCGSQCLIRCIGESSYYEFKPRIARYDW